MKQKYLITAILAGSIICLGSPVQAITVTTTYTYDAINRLTHVATQSGFNVAYEYDASGNIQKVISQTGSVTPTPVEVIHFLQVVVGQHPSGATTSVDVNGDERIGLPEAINTLQKLSQ